jgi:hypothetical protein
MSWTNYSQEQPKAAGVYRWRLPSVAVPGIYVICLAHFRCRGAGYQEVLSPAFDYWDGYSVVVPANTQWKSAENSPQFSEYLYKELEVEGVENTPCPFCGKVPAWHAVEGDYSGTVINGRPHRFSQWWLVCCSWGSSPHLKDPRELAQIRNAALAACSRNRELETVE